MSMDRIKRTDRGGASRCRAPESLNIHRIKMAALCSFALSCSAIFANESSNDSQRAAIIALNTQISDCYCEHRYDRAAKAFEQVLPMLEKVSYFSERYLATSYLNYSDVLSRLHRTDDSSKYAAKARELEAKAKEKALERSKQRPTSGLQPSPSPRPISQAISPEPLVPPALPTMHGAPTDIEVAPYIADLQRRLRRCWFPPADSEGKIGVVTFSVHSMGTVSSVKIEKSTSSVDYDTAMRNAIENAAPFRRIGCECPIHFRCTFTGSNRDASGVHLERIREK